MKRLLLLGFLLTGCATSATEGEHQADSGAMQAGQVNPTQNSPKSAPAIKPVGNPNRVYQLDTLRKTDLDLKGHTIHAWIMDDDGKQEEGMMFLEDKDVKADEGMLFAFDTVQPKNRPDGRGPSGFWMRNTLIPLDIVYLSPQDKVIRIANGKVRDDTNLPAGADYKNVIELKAGTAAKYGLKPGDTVIIPKLPKA